MPKSPKADTIALISIILIFFSITMDWLWLVVVAIGIGVWALLAGLEQLSQEGR